MTMNDENKSIHEFDFELIYEYFPSLERQGSGSPEATSKALGISNAEYLLMDLNRFGNSPTLGRGALSSFASGPWFDPLLFPGFFRLKDG